MTTKPTRRGRSRIQPWLETDLVRRLEDLAASRGVTETSLLEEALRQYLDATLGATLLLRQGNLHSRKLRMLHRDVEVLSEALAVGFKFVFALLPQVPEDKRQPAKQ